MLRHERAYVKRLVILLRRARAGLQRHIDRHAPMSIPVRDTDSDVVIADIDAALADPAPAPEVKP